MGYLEKLTSIFLLDDNSIKGTIPTELGKMPLANGLKVKVRHAWLLG